jgi:hypothetical protein
MLALDRIRRGGRQACHSAACDRWAWRAGRCGCRQRQGRGPIDHMPSAFLGWVGSKMATAPAIGTTPHDAAPRPGPERHAEPPPCPTVAAGCTAAQAQGLGPKRARRRSAHHARSTGAIAKRLSLDVVRLEPSSARARTIEQLLGADGGHDQATTQDSTPGPFFCPWNRFRPRLVVRDSRAA